MPAREGEGGKLVGTPQLLLLGVAEAGGLHAGHLELLIVDGTPAGEEHSLLADFGRCLLQEILSLRA